MAKHWDFLTSLRIWKHVPLPTHMPDVSFKRIEKREIFSSPFWDVSQFQSKYLLTCFFCGFSLPFDTYFEFCDFDLCLWRMMCVLIILTNKFILDSLIDALHWAPFHVYTSRNWYHLPSSFWIRTYNHLELTFDFRFLWLWTPFLNIWMLWVLMVYILWVFREQFSNNTELIFALGAYKVALLL